MKLVTVITLLLSIYVCDGQRNSTGCPRDFIKLRGNCYHFSAIKSNWYDALTSCLRMNSSLLSIESIQESFAIKSYLLHTNQTNFYWTSGTDAHDEGHFHWQSTMKPFNFTDWCQGEPNNFEVGEHCVHLDSRRPTGHTWCWNDIPCDIDTSNNELIYHICERDLV